MVGSVRGTTARGTVEIGRLVVDDGWLRQGIGSALMELLEAVLSRGERFELFTGAEADIPLALYGKRGYREYRRRAASGVLLVWLEKPGRPRYDVTATSHARAPFSGVRPLVYEPLRRLC